MKAFKDGKHNSLADTYYYCFNLYFSTGILRLCRLDTHKFIPQSLNFQPYFNLLNFQLTNCLSGSF